MLPSAGNLDVDTPVSRAVKFAEIDALPCPQFQMPSLNQNCFAGTDEGGFDVGIAVTFGVAVVASHLR